MLIRRQTLDALASGAIDTVFRRWDRARVKVGTRLRTAVGVLEVAAVDVVGMTKLTAQDARRAGHGSVSELRAELRDHGSGAVHRIRLRLVGDDPRIALREKPLTEADAAALGERLAAMDARSASPWVRDTLRAIARSPAVRAADLAAELGLETRAFKSRVRRLKELGLTESLETGYRLSPRGRAWLARAPARRARKPSLNARRRGSGS